MIFLVNYVYASSRSPKNAELYWPWTLSGIASSREYSVFNELNPCRPFSWDIVYLKPYSARSSWVPASWAPVEEGLFGSALRSNVY